LIVVLDASLPAVRVYDASGGHLRDIGRSGRGPGEFGEVIAFAAVGDNVAVLDQSGELEVMTAGGKYVRSWRASLTGILDARYNARAAGVLPDGSVVLRAEERLFGRVTGEYRQTVGLLRVTGGGAPDTLGWFRGDSIRTDVKGVPVPRPYLPEAGLLWSGAGARVFVATADSSRVSVVATAGGAHRRDFVVNSTQTVVSEADIAEVVVEWSGRGATANDRRVIREFVEGRPRSRLAPRFRSIVAVADDEVWIELWPRRGDDAEWLIHDAAGQPRASVFLPAKFKVQSAGRDWVLVVARTDNDVQHVNLHRLRRSSP
jgi:hypothetical protein